MFAAADGREAQQKEELALRDTGLMPRSVCLRPEVTSSKDHTGLACQPLPSIALLIPLGIRSINTTGNKVWSPDWSIHEGPQLQ